MARKRKNSQAEASSTPSEESFAEVPSEESETMEAANMESEDFSLDEEVDDDLDDDDDDDDDDEEEDSAEASDASGEKVKKPRKPRGPRQVIFVVAANVELAQDVPDVGKKGEVILIQEAIQVTTPAEKADFDPTKGRREAAEVFEKRWGEKPQAISVALYERKGTPGTQRKRDTININIGKRAKFIGSTGTAIHKDWKVLVNFTDDPSIVYIMYEKPITAPSGDKKPQKPAPKYVEAKSLQNLKKDEDSAQA